MARVIRNLKESLEANPDTHIQADELPTIFTYKTEMIQLFQNLISNALKYRSKKPPAIAILNKSTDEAYVIGVQDNGIGIEESYYDKIFIIFQRLHSSKSLKGTGIGLAICKKIVENLNGKIWVESKVDQGSTFWMKIPK